MMRDMALLVLFFAVITAPLLWHVTSAGPIAFVGCNKTTCEPAIMEKHHGTGLAFKDVQAIGDSSECPEKCSDVHAFGQSAHVMGVPADLRCKAWGGDNCLFGTVEQGDD